MIVNTAYMYMGEKGPSVNPYIWEGGTVNYPYTLYGTAAFHAAQSRFLLNTDDAVRFTLPLKKFTKITFGIAAGIGRPTRSSITLIKNGVESSPVYFSPSVGSVVVDIPAEYQDDNIVVRVFAGSGIYLTSGVMS